MDVSNIAMYIVYLKEMLALNFDSYKKVITFNIIIHNYLFTIIFCYTNKFCALKYKFFALKTKSLL